MSKHKKQDCLPDDDVLEATIQKVLRASGRLLPQSEAEIAATEEAISKQQIELPDSLLCPPSGPYASSDKDIVGRIGAEQTESFQNLARAARNGGNIPPEVLRQMEDDRVAALKKMEETGGSNQTSY